MGKTLKCPAVRLSRQTEKAVRKLNLAHVMNLNAMRQVAKALKKIHANPDNVIQGPDDNTLAWAINVLNNPEEAEDGD